MHNQKLREKIFSDIQEYWLSVEYMENLNLDAILKIIMQKDLRTELIAAAFKYLASNYDSIKEESDMWTDDIEINGKLYSFNFYDSEGFTCVDACPVIVDKDSCYTREDTNNEINLFRIKETNGCR